jgi:p-methyltransferase
MDCLLLGYYETSLDKVIDGYAKMRRHTGAYRHQLHAVIQFRGRWMHYTDVFNEIISGKSGSRSDLHLMRMPNLAVSYLKSFLASRGINAEIVNFCNAEKERLDDLLNSKPAAVAITTTYYVTDTPVIELIGHIRNISPDSLIILGGPFVNNICLSSGDLTTQDYVFEKLGADIYVSSAQGELTLARTLAELKDGSLAGLPGVPSLIFSTGLLDGNYSHRAVGSGQRQLHNSPFVRTPVEIENNDLNENRIDWGLFPGSFYAPVTFMRTSRGCPFDCAFCSFPAMEGQLGYSRVDVIEKEMKQLSGAGVRYIIFIDDSFNVPLSRFKEILKMMISNNFNFKWVSYFRCSHVDSETFDLMQQSGCCGVFLGIESGDQGMLDRMNKRADIEQYRSGIRNLHERGIFTFISLIVGFPGETEQSVRRTIEFLEETRPTFMKAELYFHTHNVPIHKEAYRYGLRGSGYGWRHSTMDWETACDHLEKMYATVQGPQICPVYLFDFWAIPYLLSKGISLDQVKRFLELCRPLLLKNINLREAGDDEKAYSSLYELGRELAGSISH